MVGKVRKGRIPGKCTSELSSKLCPDREGKRNTRVIFFFKNVVTIIAIGQD